MDRIKALFAQRKGSEQEYAPLNDESQATENDSAYVEAEEETPFSWMEYFIFALIGVAMLWAWNMFLAAAPYFQKRLVSDDWARENYQPAILSVSTFTNLGVMLALTNIQSSASYPLRIGIGITINMVAFVLLTLSTSIFLDVSPSVYLGFLLVMVASSAWGTALIQNGVFAFAASFGRPQYMQAIMAGQGVAGVLPPIAQIISVLVVPQPERSGSIPKPPPPPVTGISPSGHRAASSAFIYFLTAVAVSAATLVAFAPLVRRYNRLIERRLVDRMAESTTSVQEAERASRRAISMPALLRKLHWLAGAVFMCFVVTMFFPVFTAKILSVRPASDGRIFTPPVFIPLAFFFWNLGDLTGRITTALPLSLQDQPAALFAISLARVLFLPLYMLCNIRGHGAIVNSDVFYLFVVQFFFGLSNGWLGSSSMMATSQWVHDEEREAAGGFMGLCLVAGLSVGSLLSFTAAGI